MEIKELEKLLSVSRSNIRFYEKEGLIRPKRGKNNYRDYSEADAAMLRKFIVLRKLGFTVEEISAMQKGELQLGNALGEDIGRLQAEIERLEGALETAQRLFAEQPTFESMDENRYWDKISQAESKGKKFVDICKDYVNAVNDSWKEFFAYDFKESDNKKAVLIICGICIALCLISGIAHAVRGGTFWEGFRERFGVTAGAALLLAVVYLIGRKRSKSASKAMTVFEIVFYIILLLVVLFLVVMFAIALASGMN